MPKPELKAIVNEARALIVLGTPLVIHNLANMGMQFTDTVMAGQLSAVALAAVAVGGAIYTPLFLLIVGLLLSISPTTAQLFGAGRYSEIGHYTRQGFWLALMAAVIGLLIMRNAAPLLRVIGISSDVLPVAADYLRAIAWGLPATAFYHVLRFTSEGISHTRPLLGIALLGLALNVPLNYILMYGKFGLPALGAVGAGFSSAIVMWVMFFALLIYVRRRALYSRLHIFARFEWPRRRELTELAALGAPIGIAIFMEVALFATTTLLMAKLGVIPIAAHQVAVNFSGMMFMVPMGLAMASTIRVGQAIGRGQPERARFAGFTAVGVCGCFMVISALFMLTFRYAIADLYSDDAAVIQLAASLFIMAALFQLPDGLQVAGAGALRGLKDTRVPMLMTILAYWIIGFPLAWIFGIVLDYGPRAIWLGLIGGLTAAAILLNWRFYRSSRKK